MTDELRASDPYEAILIDLRAKRAQIDHAIATVEAVRVTVAVKSFHPLASLIDERKHGFMGRARSGAVTPTGKREFNATNRCPRALRFRLVVKGGSMTDDRKRGQAAWYRGNPGGWLRSTGAGQVVATMAAARRGGDDSRVPALTDFTADASPLLRLAKKLDQLKGAVEAAEPAVKDAAKHLDKKS